LHGLRAEGGEVSDQKSATPRTNKVWESQQFHAWMQPYFNLSCQLERDLAAMTTEYDALESRLKDMTAERDRAIDMGGKLTQALADMAKERDEANRRMLTISDAYSTAISRAKSAEDECQEQARLNGMGAEREAKLIAERDEWKWVYERFMAHANAENASLIAERDCYKEVLLAAEFENVYELPVRGIELCHAVGKRVAERVREMAAERDALRGNTQAMMEEMARKDEQIDRLTVELEDAESNSDGAFRDQVKIARDALNECDELRKENERWKQRHIDEGIRGGRAIAERDALREEVERLRNECKTRPCVDCVGTRYHERRREPLEMTGRIVLAMPLIHEPVTVECAERYVAAVDAHLAGEGEE
jgi:hypothetical protein